jgi:hypothetical protein
MYADLVEVIELSIDLPTDALIYPASDGFSIHRSSFRFESLDAELQI